MRAPLIRFIGKWFRETESVEDVFQETFLAVHLSLPRFEGKCRLTTWVYSLAQHKVMDRLSEKYRPGRGDHVILCAQACEVEATDPGPDEAAHQSLLIARIRSVAETIPELYRKAWRLRDVEAMSGEEAAEALGDHPHPGAGALAPRPRPDCRRPQEGKARAFRGAASRDFHRLATRIRQGIAGAGPVAQRSGRAADHGFALVVEPEDRAVDRLRQPCSGARGWPRSLRGRRPRRPGWPPGRRFPGRLSVRRCASSRRAGSWP